MDAAVHPDDRLHDVLCTAHRTGLVTLATDPAALARPGSPVHSEWDSLGPLLLLMLGNLGVLVFTGLAGGIASMAVSVPVLLLGLRRWVAYRIGQRATALLRAGPEALDALWGGGGVALILRGPRPQSCLAPKGNWRRFVRDTLVQAEG